MSAGVATRFCGPVGFAVLLVVVEPVGAVVAGRDRRDPPDVVFDAVEEDPQPARRTRPSPASRKARHLAFMGTVLQKCRNSR